MSAGDELLRPRRILGIQLRLRLAAVDVVLVRFRPRSHGVWELQLEKAVTKLGRGKVTVSVADRQGNVSRVERTFSVRK